MRNPETYESFSEIKTRLDEIVQAVSDDTMPLDEALSLYEEAVKLGTRVSTLIESAQGEETEREVPVDEVAPAAEEPETASLS